MNIDFLISSERSGSNLITKIIDNHSVYSGPSPAHLIRAFSLNMKKYGDFSITKNWNLFINDFLNLFVFKIGIWNTTFSFNELSSLKERSLPNAIKYIYTKEVKSLNKKRCFIKEVKTYQFYDFITKNFKNSKFIWLVRDPRDVASSWSKSPVHRGDIVRGTKVWKEDQQNTILLYKKLLNKNKILLVKYEDLISDQNKVTQDVCTFLGIKHEPNMINYHQNELSAKNANQTDNWKNLNKRIITTNHKKFLKNLNKNQIQYIEYLCKDEMNYFDYNFEFPALTKEEFAEISSKLSLLERNEKNEYHLIDNEEKFKRKRWQESFNTIKNSKIITKNV
jgi:hypothetical protein